MIRLILNSYYYNYSPIQKYWNSLTVSERQFCFGYWWHSVLRAKDEYDKIDQNSAFIFWYLHIHVLNILKHGIFDGRPPNL